MAAYWATVRPKPLRASVLAAIMACSADLMCRPSRTPVSSTSSRRPRLGGGMSTERLTAFILGGLVIGEEDLLDGQAEDASNGEGQG